MRFAIGKVARFDPMEPNANKGVSQGAHELRVYTSFARKLGWAEPWVELFWQTPLMGRDIWVCYVPWLEHVARAGPLAALGAPFGDYTPPYYYMLALASPLVGHVPSEHIVKLVSLAGTLLLAGAVLHLARTLRIPISPYFNA